MEFYSINTGEYNVLVKINNQSQEMKLSPPEIGNQILRGAKVLEDISKSPIRLFIDIKNDSELENILQRFPYCQYTIFRAPTFSRVVTDIICEDLHEMNRIRNELGYRSANKYIDMPGLSSIKIDSRNTRPIIFMVQNIH